MICIPLLKDNHNHLFTYSNLSNTISLFNTKTKDQALKIINNDIKNFNRNLFIFTGWFDSYINFEKSELDNLPPLIICNNSLHKYLFNETAKQFISENFPEWIENYNNQEWIEKNLMKILDFISSLCNFNAENFISYLNNSLTKGVFFQSEMFLKNNVVINFLSKINFKEFTEIWTSPDFFSQSPEKIKNLFCGIKIFTDGAIGACSAAIDSYKIKSNPLLIYSDYELSDIFEKILNYKTNIAIHSIGDLAIEQVLRVLKNFRQKINCKIRLEHAQFISKKQALEAKKLGIILSMQPNFNMDSIIYADRLTDKYIKANNPFRMLIDDAGFIPGIDLIFGSDGMPTGVEEALRNSLFPPIPSQRISIDEFISAYCLNNFDKGKIFVDIDLLKKKVTPIVEVTHKFDLNSILI